MDLFIDTAVYEEIEEIYSWGILKGVTTNPSLIYQSNENFESLIQKMKNQIQIHKAQKMMLVIA